MDLKERLTVAGLAGTLKALNKLDPEVAKQVNKELNLAGRVIRDEAKTLVPQTPSPRLRNWGTKEPRRRLGQRNSDGTIRAGSSSRFPAWNPGASRKSIRSSRREFVLTIQSQTDRALQVYELAGTKGGKRGSGSPQGRTFLRLLPSVRLNTSKRITHGRVMRTALRNHYPETRLKIMDAAYRAALYVQRSMP